MIFRKKKYHFNQDTLTYEEIKLSKGRRFFILFSYISVALVLIAVSGTMLNGVMDSPETLLLISRRNVLSAEMKHILEKGEKIKEVLEHDVFVRNNTYRMILQMDTLPGSLRYAGFGGSAAKGEMAMQGDLNYQMSDMISVLTHQLQIQYGSFKTLQQKANQYSEILSHLPAIQPIAKNDLIRISDDFGVRSDPFFFIEKAHNGLDFIAPLGKNVYATGDGIVTFVQYSRNGYGNEIVIDHRYSFSSRYGHLNEIKVKEGDTIKRGEVIGTVGETGRATGPHLHYEVLFEKNPVNPSYYFDTSLTKEEFAQIIRKAKTQDKQTY